MFVLLLLSFALCALASDAEYSLIGRSLASVGGVKFGWPGSGISFLVSPTLETSKVTLSFALPQIGWYNIAGKVSDGVRLAIYINGNVVSSHLVTPSENTFDIKVTVPETGGRVDVLRVSEDIYSTDDMNSVVLTSFVSTSLTSAPPPRSLDILFVGDSDTAGFGIHSHPYDPSCLNPYNLWSKVSDASLSWASQLADLLDADRTITAVSGVGIEEAYGCKPFARYADNALPFLYDDASKWDYTSLPPPDLVIILLGPNDCGASNGNKCPKGFEKKYTELMLSYDSHFNGQSQIISVIGGSSSGQNPALIDAITAATDKANEDLSKTSPIITLTPSVWNEINDHSNGYNGCFGHYNEKGHALVANDIRDQLVKGGWV